MADKKKPVVRSKTKKSGLKKNKTESKTESSIQQPISQTDKLLTGCKPCQTSTPGKPISTKTFIIICLALAIIILGLALIPQYLNKNETSNNKYNNFEFFKFQDGFWYTQVQKGPQPFWIPFYYHPRELENIPVEPYLRGLFFEISDNNGTIYITLDPESEDNRIVIAGVEISRITGSRYGLLNVPTYSAFIKPPINQQTETKTPIITCANANNQTLVIWIVLSDKNLVYSYDYCIILEARNYEDMIKVADRLVYHLLGIMD